MDRIHNIGKILKNYIVNVSLMLISLIVIFLLTEIVLRFTDYKFYLKYDYQYPRYYYVEDDTAGYDLAPNYPPTPFNILDTPPNSMKIWTNELSCFDKSYNNEFPFILLIGDSFTWGFVNFEFTYGSIIEKFTNIRTLKCGVSGYGLRQELIKTDKVITKIEKRPNLLILSYYIGNDLIDDYLFPRNTVINGYLVEKTKLDYKTGERIEVSKKDLYDSVNSYNERKSILSNVKRQLFASSIIYNILRESNLLRDLFNKIGFVKESSCELIFKQFSYAFNPKKYKFLEKAWDFHTKNIKALKDYATNRGLKLLIILIPAREQVYPFLRPKIEEQKDADWLYTNNRLKEIFAKEAIEYIDLLPIFQQYADLTPRKFLNPRKDLYWRHDGHWNENGQYLAGLVVAKHILENHIINVKNRDVLLSEINDKLNNFKAITQTK